MARMIFVNLPVRDLDRSIAFYEAVGARNDPRFTGNGAAMMTFSDTIHAMLMTHDRFAGFTSKTIADAHREAQVLFNLSAESRHEVDTVVERAGAAGAVLDPSPIDDYAFMYGRSFEDPDGHTWGVTWLDVEAMLAGGAVNAEPTSPVPAVG